MSLFKLGDFVLHSGRKSKFKIDCDCLTDEDWEALAQVISSNIKFGDVYGIPDGGLKLEEKLNRYKTEGSNLNLIVDDVLTTGRSMKKARANLKGGCIGVVIFARGKCPWWVIPIFRLNSGFLLDSQEGIERRTNER